MNKKPSDFGSCSAFNIKANKERLSKEYLSENALTLLNKRLFI